MSMNYDATQVGVPFARVSGINIRWPDGAGGIPQAEILQALAVLLKDGTSRHLEALQTLQIPLDLKSHGDDPIAIVHPATGLPLGPMTSLNTAFLHVLAIARHFQILSGQ